ncbi:6-phospho-3-hexuloisomerase [Rhodococcus sp. B10]|uniref:6-phospho-3-hexuloisomerase n=1 Tax=Rhodococcus sp. B10 TaxID=2695876 RepID=UPI0014322526|nr:6-phospho-3-hexuloisomerase [Rhodococcus sp. B10]NIL78950.1 Phosphoheptose isomerase [Rhodococcus sp. B10]
MTSVVEQTTRGFDDARATVLQETEGLLSSVAAEEWDRAGALIKEARRIFVIGNGRSGLAAQMAAMRLMHLGLQVHVAGEVTAPAIGENDLLIAVSGSGTTLSVVSAAQTAKKVGAKVLSVTTTSRAPLAEHADESLVLPAANKQDHSAARTQQYSGSLFEQSVLLAFDALFHALWAEHEQSAEQLWTRHANIG